MEKKNYEEPRFEIVEIKDEDILTLSGTINFIDIPSGEGGLFS